MIKDENRKGKRNFVIVEDTIELFGFGKPSGEINHVKLEFKYLQTN